jgi:peroxiredoxin
VTASTQTTSLTARTEELRAGIRDLLEEFDSSARALGARHYPAPEPGDKAPEFVLPDARGREVRLADLLGESRVVLVFYRGAWCPYCNLQLSAFQARLDEIKAAGAELVAISPQTPDNSLSLAEKAELTFTVLSDAGNAVAERYGLRWELSEQDKELYAGVGIDLNETNGDDSMSLPASATFVVNQDGTLAYASVSGDYRFRVGPEEVLAALRA